VLSLIEIELKAIKAAFGLVIFCLCLIFFLLSRWCTKHLFIHGRLDKKIHDRFLLKSKTCISSAPIVPLSVLFRCASCSLSSGLAGRGRSTIQVEIVVVSDQLIFIQ